MRKNMIILLLTVALMLSGCGSGGEDFPEIPGWEDSWVRVGPLLGVAPLEGFTLDDYEDSQAVKGIYYATWVSGVPVEEENNVKVYEAQIYLLMKKCDDSEEATTEIETWIGWEKEAYQTGAREIADISSQEFRLYPLEETRNENHYSGGMAAFAVRGSWAVSVELLFRENHEADVRQIMEDYLSCFRYCDAA